MRKISDLYDLAHASNHFLWKEFYCPLAKMAPVTDLTLFHVAMLETLRVEIDEPLRVNSGYRSPEHNSSEAVQGAPNSMHLQFATDKAPVRDTSMDKLDRLAEIANELGFSGIGRYNTFLHLDCREFIDRKPARWDLRSETA